MVSLKIERSLEEKGKILGMDVTFVATVMMRERPQGGMFTHGNGIMMTMKGEKVTLHGSGISTVMKGPGMSFARGAVCPVIIPVVQQAQ